MLKNVKKSKILLSLIVMILMVVLFGNMVSLATEGNTSNNPVTITATSDNTGAGSSNTNTNSNATQITATNSNTNTNTNNVGANTNNSVNAPNISASVNNSANNAANNASIYNNTSNQSGLPYTGTDSKAIFFVVVFAVSAVYAYKKVSDYNV